MNYVRLLREVMQGMILALLVFLVCSFPPSAVVHVRAQVSPPLFSTTLIVSTSNAIRRQYAANITNNMVAAGIDATLVYLDFNSLVARLFFYNVAQGASYAQGGYDIGFLGWGYSQPIPDFSNEASDSFAPSGNNYALYSNPQVDSLISTFYKTTDLQTQIQLSRSIQEQIFHDAPYNWIYDVSNLVAEKPSYSAWGNSSLFNEVTFPDIQHWSGASSLTLAEASQATNLDPAVTPLSNNYYDSYIYGAIMGGALQEIDARNDSLIPGTAQTISASPDNLTWTVTIKPGIYFQDGVEVTADDFVYTQYALTNSSLGSTSLNANVGNLGNYVTFTFYNNGSEPTSLIDDNSNGGSHIVGSWTATSRYTFQFTLPSVYAFTRQVYCAFAPLPKHIMEQYSLSGWNNAPFSVGTSPHTYTWDTTEYGGNGSYVAHYGPIGAGPYVLTSFDGTTATLQKYSGYWNRTGLEGLGQFSVNTYTVKWVSAPNNAMTDLGNGLVNVLDPNYGLAPNRNYLQGLGASVFFDQSLGWQEMGFNMENPVFGTGTATPLGQTNPSLAAEAARHVRKAISHLIPRTYIVNQLADGAGYPAAGPLGPGWGIWHDSSLQPDTYDMNAALLELAAAGYGTICSPGEGSLLKPGDTVSCSLVSGGGTTFLSWGSSLFSPANSASPSQNFVASAPGTGSITVAYNYQSAVYEESFNYSIQYSSFSGEVAVTADSPINVLVTDPLGRSVGANATYTFNEIPGASYSGPGTEPQVITIPNPVPGAYVVEAFGIGVGAFHMKIQSVNSGGSVVGTQTFNGTASVGGNSVYTLGLDVTGVVTPNGSGISLSPGWNLVSLPIVPYNTKISKVLSTLIAAKDFTTVLSYQSGKWISATLSKGKLSGSLTTMQDGVGYWIYMTKADKLNVVGYVIAPPPASPPTYSLSQGWNLVGFKPQPNASASESVSTYLSSINGDYSVVWIYDNPTGTWVRATGTTQIQVADALWVYVTTPATLRP